MFSLSWGYARLDPFLKKNEKFTDLCEVQFLRLPFLLSFGTGWSISKNILEWGVYHASTALFKVESIPSQHRDIFHAEQRNCHWLAEVAKCKQSKPERD